MPAVYRPPVVFTRSTALWTECRYLVGLGYTVAQGPEMETDYYNFEALNFLPPPRP